MTTTYHRPADPREAAEFDAFERLLPALRERHPDEYVAVCGGEVVAHGFWLDAVDREAKRLAPGRAVYLGWVEPGDEYVVRIGGVTVVEELPE
jgi:hypothetical protein